MTHKRSTAADALLLIAPDCTRCPVVLDGLAQLLKEGAIGRLEVVNIAAHPETAERLGVRSVPWGRIGPFELEGLHGYAELKGWAAAASGQPDYQRYLAYLIGGRRLDRALALIRTHKEHLDDLIELIGAPGTDMGVRIGAGALLEDLQDSGLLVQALPRLLELCGSPDPGIRADACHYLSLVGEPAAIPRVQALLDDPDPQVREIAQETLECLELASYTHPTFVDRPSL